jgi:hypothetical protein
MLGYDDDDGDDFGLPSLSSMKRRARRRETQDKPDLNSLSPALGSSTWNDSPASRRYSNSADIAVERPAPSYPMPKKSEGKILRPQYKEILRGALCRPSSAGEENNLADPVQTLPTPSI